MADEKLSDIEYFVKKIRENKNNPEQIDLCCRRVLLLLDINQMKMNGTNVKQQFKGIIYVTDYTRTRRTIQN